MKNLWLLLDNRMGSVGQARGVALKLEKDFNVIEKQIVYNKFAKLPNFLKGKSLLGVTKQSKEEIKNNFPDLVISASRRTAPIARWIKKQSPKTKIIQFIHPGNAGLKEFDEVFVPQHDKGRRKHTNNITYIFGAPHRVTKEKLQDAKKQWQKEFAKLPKPLTAVIVGGGAKFDETNAKNFATEIKSLKEKIGGSILITTSARTPALSAEVILDGIKNIPSHQFIWGKNQNQENPFLGYLACADNIIVTGESVSMASESCGTGSPVYIFSGQGFLKEKHHRFVASLFQQQYACDLSNKNIAKFKPKQILDCAQFIADKIKKHF